MSRRFFEGDQLASDYLKSRPHPPPDLISRVIEFLKEEYVGDLTTALDVGCGSGQNTRLIAEYFGSVIGIDVSSSQIEAAIMENQSPNIKFLIGSAENLPGDDQSVQLITSCTAAHWFDLPKFFAESKRVLCKNGVMALYCNELFKVKFDDDLSKSEHLNKLLEDLVHEEPLKSYWPKEIQMWESEYRGIEIPYRDFLRETSFRQVQEVTLEIVIERIKTWPAYQSYLEAVGEEPAKELISYFTDRFFSIINLDIRTSSATVPISVENSYFLLMARI